MNDTGQSRTGWSTFAGGDPFPTVPAPSEQEDAPKGILLYLPNYADFS